MHKLLLKSLCWKAFIFAACPIRGTFTVILPGWPIGPGVPGSPGGPWIPIPGSPGGPIGPGCPFDPTSPYKKTVYMLKTTASLFFFILLYITSEHSFLSLPSFRCSPHHPSLLDPQFFSFLSGKSRPSSEINHMAYDAIRLIFPERKVKISTPTEIPLRVT